MIDVHCHLNFHSFEKDYDDVIKDALSKGVTRIINTGTKIDSSQHAIQLAEQYDELYAIVGVHPHHADKVELNKEAEQKGLIDSGQARMTEYAWIEALEEMAKHPKVLAIGEIGMDYYRYKSNGVVEKKLQEEVFEAQIELAARTKLPLQIHNRQAGEDVIRILKNHKDKLQPIPGMFHCFAGSLEVLKSALQMGFYIGFDGNSTYKGIAPGETTDLRDIARYVPLDRMVCETDSPYLTPEPHRGSRNIPAYVIIVGQYLAELKDVPFAEFVVQTDKNVYTVFTKLQ